MKKFSLRDDILCIVMIAIIVVSIFTLIHIKSRTEAMYCEIPCPVCSSMTVVSLGHDDMHDCDEYRCMSCKTRFTITEAPNFEAEK